MVGQVGCVKVPVLPGSEWLARGPTLIDWSPSIASLRGSIEMLQEGVKALPGWKELQAHSTVNEK